MPETLELALPQLSCRVSFGDVEESELCSVLGCRLTRELSRRGAEVQAWEWWRWDRFRIEAADADCHMSPWARRQAPPLE